MPEGLSPTEVGKEIVEHGRHREGEHLGRDRLITIAEAILLSVVALLRRLVRICRSEVVDGVACQLAEASTLRVEANRADGEAAELRNFDSSTFEAWFAAYVADNQAAMRLAEHRFRPEFRVAFDAWRATNPETNPNAPHGPTYMPAVQGAGSGTKGRTLDQQARNSFRKGEEAGATADKYVRLTVVLASILFLVGISTHFPLRGVRYGLIGARSRVARPVGRSARNASDSTTLNRVRRTGCSRAERNRSYDERARR